MLIFVLGKTLFFLQVICPAAASFITVTYACDVSFGCSEVVKNHIRKHFLHFNAEPQLLSQSLNDNIGRIYKFSRWKFLVRSKPLSKLTVMSHPIRRELSLPYFWFGLSSHQTLDVIPSSSWQTATKLIPKLTNNSKFGVNSTSWQSTHKLTVCD